MKPGSREKSGKSNKLNKRFQWNGKNFIESHIPCGKFIYFLESECMNIIKVEAHIIVEDT